MADWVTHWKQAKAGSEDDRHEVFVIAIGTWLAAFWFCPYGWWHLVGLGVMVFPALLWVRDEWARALRGERWFQLAAVLLLWQWMTRWWSDGGGSWTASLIDIALVVVLLSALLVLGRDIQATRRVFRWMVLAAAATTLVSLFVFYGPSDRTVSGDRLRNVFIYYGFGLHPVLTGMLCGFGALAAAWATGRSTSHRWTWIWRISLAVLTVGVISTQSRGAYLMFVSGFGMLVVLERRKAVAAVVTVLVSIALYFGPFLWGTPAAKNMVSRGATGRFSVYQWLLDHMDGTDRVIGRGMATPPTIPEEVFNWFVAHPHSGYLTQFYLTGVIGSVLLLALLAWAAWDALRLALKGETLLLIMLTGGAAALVFDGGHILSVFSEGRMEVLLVVVPAGLAVARRRVLAP